MTSARTTEQSDIEVHIENVGGISQSDVHLQPGVTVLSGRNATNRTSFLQALMAAMGSANVSLKADSEEGLVSLELNKNTYTRKLYRSSGGAQTDGNPYLSDPTVADLFAFLLESNEARRAVRQGDDLREIMMRPVDTEVIKAEIARLEKSKQDIDDKLEELDKISDRIPELEKQRREIVEQISAVETELADAQTALNEADESVQRSKEGQNKLETKLEKLKETRDELETVRYELQTERESLDSLRADQEELQDGDEDSGVLDEDLSSLNAEVERLHERREQLDSTIQQLQNVIQFNEQMLDGTDEEIVAALRGENNEAVTDQLLPDDEVVCWTCGTEVEQNRIDGTLDQLRALSQEKVTERRSLSDEISDLQSRRKQLQRKQREREQQQQRLQQIKGEIERREATIEELETQRGELTERVAELERTVEALEDETYSVILDQHKRVNKLEFQLDQLADERREITQEKGRIERQLATREELSKERETVTEQLTEQRTRIEQIETEAVQQFNERMDEVLSLLEYDNLDRIWIERSEQQVQDGRGTTTEPVFDLHIVRTAESGSVYEDTIDHLSESEREVTGLIFALSGYLVHDVYDTVPFLLLDSLEAIDSDRIATLVEYIGEFADNLVVALLPEDAAALTDHHHRITEV